MSCYYASSHLYCIKSLIPKLLTRPATNGQFLVWFEIFCYVFIILLLLHPFHVYWGFKRCDKPQTCGRGIKHEVYRLWKEGSNQIQKLEKFYFSIHVKNVVTNLSYVYPSNKFFWSISQGLVWSFISKYLWTNIIIRYMFTNRSNNKFASSIGQSLVRLFLTNNSCTNTIVQYIFINRSSLLVLHSQGGKCSSTYCSLSCLMSTSSSYMYINRSSVLVLHSVLFPA